MDQRTSEQKKEHLRIERKLAAELRASTSAERQSLYNLAYDELFRQVPDLPMLLSQSAEEAGRYVGKELTGLKPLIHEDTIFAEIGPGNCGLSIAVAPRVAHVYAIDVSKSPARIENAPANLSLILSDGTSIPLPPNSVDVVYSNQLMEHLHPDDAHAQLRNVFQVLKKGGRYYCVTPNRVTGPHDISREFDPVATGLHLREYSVSELEETFSSAGFSGTKIALRLGSKIVFLPAFPFKILESFFDLMPHRLRKACTFNRPITFLLGIRIIATK